MTSNHAVAEPLISVTGLGRRFPPAVDALRNATFDVRAGETLALTGPSGAGKSTLLSLLGLLDTATSGSYRLLGEDVSGMVAHQQTGLRRAKMGFVFQAFHLVQHLTVLKNVELGLRSRGVSPTASRARAREVLDQVGMQHLESASPTTLSGGEQQRVAIARALAFRPPILLCDEPTGNLDTANSESVMALLAQSLGPDTAMIIVTHDADVAAFCSRRISVHDGITQEA